MKNRHEKVFLKKQKRSLKKKAAAQRDAELAIFNGRPESYWRRRVALHEAAHLVCCLVFEIPVEYVKVGKRGSGICNSLSVAWERDPDNTLTLEAKGIRYAVQSMAGVAAECQAYQSASERSETYASGVGDIQQALSGMGMAGLEIHATDNLFRDYARELAMVISSADTILLDCQVLWHRFSRLLIERSLIESKAISDIANVSDELRHCRQKWSKGLDLTLIADIRFGAEWSFAHESTSTQSRGLLMFADDIIGNDLLLSLSKVAA